MQKKDKASVDIKTGNVTARESSSLAIGVGSTATVSVLAAPEQTALAQTLKALADAVKASQDLSADKKEEQVKVINQIGKEATEPKPNKTLLKILVDGLLATLKAVPDIASAAAAATPILSKLFL